LEIIGRMKLAKRFNINDAFLLFIFALLPIIDVYRTSGNSEQIMIATQSIGFVVACMIIVHFNIRNFLKWYNLIWPVICLCGVYVIYVVYTKLTSVLYYQKECWLICFNFCLYSMILFNCVIKWKNNKLDLKTKIAGMFSRKNLPILFWLIYAILATIAEERIYRPGFELFYFLPLFLVSYRKEEYEKIYSNFTNGVLLGFWVVQIIAFLRRPWVIGMLRYSGMYTNCNHFDAMCLFVMLILMLKLTETRRKKTIKCWEYLFWILQYGMVVSFVILSVGRISMILACVETLVYVVFVHIILERNKITKVCRITFNLFLAVVIMLPVMFASVSYIPRIVNRPYTYDIEYNKLGDLNDSSNYVSIKEFALHFGERFALLIFDYSDVLEEEETAEANAVFEPGWENKTYFIDYQNYNSVELRRAIGLTFFVNLNMKGHTTDEWLLWVSAVEQYIHAHNIFIMEAYIYGIPAGIFFLSWMVCLVVRNTKFICNEKADICALFSLGILFLVLMFGCFEMNWQPGQIHWFALFLVTRILLQPMKTDKKKEKVQYCLYKVNKEMEIEHPENIIEQWKSRGYVYSKKKLRGEKRLWIAICMYMIETYGKYHIYCLDDYKGIVHYSFVIPYCRKFSFMQEKDYLLGPCYTRDDCRGQRIYPNMLMHISKEILEVTPEADIYILIREENLESLKGIAKTNFELVGKCTKTKILKYYKPC